MKTKEKIFWLSMIVLAIVLLALHFSSPNGNIDIGSSKHSVHKYMSKANYHRVSLLDGQSGSETYASSAGIVIVTYYIKTRRVSMLDIYPRYVSKEDEDRSFGATYLAMVLAYGSPSYSSHNLDIWYRYKRNGTRIETTLEKNPRRIKIKRMWEGE